MRQLLLNIIILFFSLQAVAQVSYLEEDEIRTLFKENPSLAAGTKYMYPETGFTHANAPKGYRAFYISHYGRHGARLETRSTPYDTVSEFLESAHRDSALTGFGEDIYRRFSAIYPSLQYSYGDLTVKGQIQHRGIADRMYRNYQSVFKGRAAVWASASLVPRCVVSMMSFLDQLRILNPKLEMSYSANMADMYYNALRYPDCFTQEDFDELKKNSPFLKEAKESLGRDIDLVPFFLRICKSMDYVNDHGGIVLASAFWNVAGNMQCLDTEENFDNLFTEEERYLMWRYSNISYAAMVGRTPMTEGLLPQMAQSLLGQILEQAENDILTGEKQIRLRFGHDSVVGPLMSLLGIEGWTEIVRTPMDIARKVHSFDIPMASNLQFVFYRNRKSPQDILVKLMYNEKDQILPLKDQSKAPFYSWREFKEHYRVVCDNSRNDIEASKERHNK